MRRAYFAAADMKAMLKTAVSTALVVVPVTVTFLDLVGYVAKVEGASMQVSIKSWRFFFFLIYKHQLQ